MRVDTHEATRTRRHHFRPSLSSGLRPGTLLSVTLAKAYGPRPVPLRVVDEVAPWGVTPAMLDNWRRYGWLGIPRPGSSGARYPWDQVMVQVRWLARIHCAGLRITAELARLGFQGRQSGAEFFYRVHGQGEWTAGSAETIGRLVSEGVGVTTLKVNVG